MKPFHAVCKKYRKHAISKLIFEKFSGAWPTDPLMQRGYGAPSQTYSPRFAPPATRSGTYVPPSALPGNKADL